MAKAGNLVVYFVKHISLSLTVLSLASDDEQSVVFVPGLMMEGNIRSESKVKCKIEECGAKLTLHSGSVFVNPLNTKSGKQPIPNKAMKEKKGAKSASLKDLCPEDKRRIANLIKELARVSEEKEETVERLKAEHESFERKIRELEDQNELIVTEREALQQQYRKCQELLSVYQKYLSEQKEKSNQSSPEFSNNRQMVSSKKNPPPLTSSDPDGSYLGILPTCTLNAADKSKQVLIGPSPVHHLQSDVAQHLPNQNHLHQVQPTESFPSQIVVRKTGSTIQGEPVVGRHYNMNEQEDIGAVRAGTSCDKDGSQPSHYGWLRNRETDNNNQFTIVQNGHFKLLTEHNVYSGMIHDPAINDQMGIMAGDILHGKKLQVDQKQQLMCQKMELELEKEKLQRLLTQHENLLLRKQQQLHESRLNYSRFKYQLSEAEDITYSEDLTDKTRIPVPNSTWPERHLRSEDDLYCGHLQHQERNIKTSTTEPQGLIAGNKMIGPFGSEQDSFRGIASLCSAGDRNKQQTGIPPLSKKDVATSPLVFNKDEQVSTATSPFWAESASYEASLVHLVDALSPISSQKHNSHIKEEYCKPRKSNIIHSRNHQKLDKTGKAPTDSGVSDDEFEESRMLEDVFFI
ncbi:LOW QUALITY PROTEIN: protein hinderin [Scyliorhinus canicula]|uniref:LOW QUALITY PROTEIN: protein hinderin n=1 Tax=Scyliorhinus canicula TaxID=7830 RepID=UPI0018F6EB6A|nr:LOW QUALITY PROTEIN: protein hinderin [Scyliorhinus canicula]